LLLKNAEDAAELAVGDSAAGDGCQKARRNIGERLADRKKVFLDAHATELRKLLVSAAGKKALRKKS